MNAKTRNFKEESQVRSLATTLTLYAFTMVSSTADCKVKLIKVQDFED